MGDVIVDISMSLDGFVTGPSPGPDAGLGIGGEPIHAWAVDGKTDEDQAVMDAMVARTGAVVMGRNLFDVIDGPNGWSTEMGYGAEREQTDMAPLVVLTHEAPATNRLGDAYELHFATDGIDAAIDQARGLAGDRDVVVMGGAGACQATLAAGLATQLHVHVAPALVGDGTRLFAHLPVATTELDPLDTVVTPHAVHLSYRLPASS